jgi:hypothetical protein
MGQFEIGTQFRRSTAGSPCHRLSNVARERVAAAAGAAPRPAGHARHRQHFAALDPFKHFAALITQVSYGYLDHVDECITGETEATSARQLKSVSCRTTRPWT